ncbi:MAG: hypothetical protein EOQ50_18395 [Mesorhizobium sp.]|uniref:hypothetical protein n=1 Tax=Mesorhizobium sp. TaxID=1871066 RepID=UPI000FE4A482|nr:hypothetical protein [Mesorhizobium sp.]RWB72938.1 MAG: hypothetical protein EOQ50_18395 [Mesorhizobium sp.]
MMINGSSLPPGYVQHEDGNGYAYMSESGRIAVRGSAVGDHLFQSSKFGTLNISAVSRELKRMKAKPLRAKLDAALKDHIRLVEIDESQVTQMTRKRRDEPVISIMASDGVNIIDGHHRLARRFADGLGFFNMYMVPGQLALHAQVQTYMQTSQGGWVRVQTGPTDDEIQAAVSDSLRMMIATMRANGVAL